MFNFNNQNFNNSNNQTNPNNQTSRYNNFKEDDFVALQNARRDLIDEIDAIIQYDDHLHNTDIEIAKSTWENIRNEELVHIGELLGLLNYLAPYQRALVEDGLKEFNERLNKE